MSWTTLLLRDDRFAAQSRVGCAIAVGDDFVLCCDEMLHCRIMKIWKRVNVSFGVFECEVSPDSRPKRSDQSLGDGRFCFLILCHSKVNMFLLSVALKKACWRARDYGPCTKTTSSAHLCSEFLQRF